MLGNILHHLFQKFILRGSYYGEVAAHLFGVVAGQIQNQQEFEKIVYQITNIKNLVSLKLIIKTLKIQHNSLLCFLLKHL